MNAPVSLEVYGLQTRSLTERSFLNHEIQTLRNTDTVRRIALTIVSLESDQELLARFRRCDFGGVRKDVISAIAIILSLLYV